MAKLDSLPIAIKCYAVAISHLWALYRVASCKNLQPCSVVWCLIMSLLNGVYQCVKGAVRDGDGVKLKKLNNNEEILTS